MVKIRVQSDVPMPRGRGPGSTRESSDITEAIRSLQPGQSFFVPALDCTDTVLQRRLTVRAVSLRKSGSIDFFLRTSKQPEEYEDDDGNIHPPHPGVRLWRRLPGDTEVSGVEEEEHEEEPETVSSEGSSAETSARAAE